MGREADLRSGVSFPGGTITYFHLPCGKLSGTTRGLETSKLSYDGPLVTREVRSGSVSATLAWTYNTDFAPASFRYAEATQTYAYDADGLLTYSAPFAVSRDASSGLALSVVASGFALSRTYNAYGEIDSVSTGAYGYALSRDSAGRIASRTETGMSGAHAWAYAYDALGRLTSATRDGTLAESYAYDADGNRVAFRAPLRGVVATVTAAFDAEDRVVACGPDAYTFTADGFLAAKHSEAGTTAYAYSPLGELAAVALPDGRAVTYAYDGAGRRVSRSVDGTVTQRYLWADATHLLAVCDGAGAVQARFLYADARVPYAADTPGGRVFLHYDQVGSLRAVTDTSASLIRTIERDSFGVVLSDTDTASPVPFGFAGGLADPDTRLVLFGARDYDPALGRWCAKDPIGFAGGDANLYGYCVGDPVGLADPAGLKCSSDPFGLSPADAWDLTSDALGFGLETLYAALFFGAAGTTALTGVPQVEVAPVLAAVAGAETSIDAVQFVRKTVLLMQGRAKWGDVIVAGGDLLTPPPFPASTLRLFFWDVWTYGATPPRECECSSHE